MVKSSKVDKRFHNPSTHPSACPYLYASKTAAKIILCGPDGTKPYRRHVWCQNGTINHTEGLYNTLVVGPCIAAPAWPSCMRPQLTRLTIPEISRTLLEFYFIIIYFNNFKLSTRVVLMLNQAIFYCFIVGVCNVSTLCNGSFGYLSVFLTHGQWRL